MDPLSAHMPAVPVAQIITGAIPDESGVEWTSLLALIVGMLLALLVLRICAVTMKHCWLQEVSNTSLDGSVAPPRAVVTNNKQLFPSQSPSKATKARR